MIGSGDAAGVQSLEAPSRLYRLCSLHDEVFNFWSRSFTDHVDVAVWALSDTHVYSSAPPFPPLSLQRCI